MKHPQTYEMMPQFFLFAEVSFTIAEVDVRQILHSFYYQRKLEQIWTTSQFLSTVLLYWIGTAIDHYI